VAGVVVGQAGWRTLFGMLAAVGAALLAASLGMPESRGDRRHLDLAGATSYVGGLILALTGVIAATDHGWTDTRVVLPVASGLALLAWFARPQRHTDHPLLDLSLLANRHIGGWLLAGLTLAVGTLGALTHVPVYLQATDRFSPRPRARSSWRSHCPC